MPSLTIVIPTLNAAVGLDACLEALSGRDAQVLVVKGGSTEARVAVTERAGVHIIHAPRGRGTQLMAGAAAARSDWLLFLHDDTVLEPGWQTDVLNHMNQPQNVERAAVFTFKLDDPAWQARVLEWLVRQRMRWLALPYGDQGLLISRVLYDAVGGFKPMPIMEDVDLIRRLGAHRVCLLTTGALTSALRWRRDGWWRRSARNLACLTLYQLGLPPQQIQKLYG